MSTAAQQQSTSSNSNELLLQMLKSSSVLQAVALYMVYRFCASSSLVLSLDRFDPRYAYNDLSNGFNFGIYYGVALCVLNYLLPFLAATYSTVGGSSILAQPFISGQSISFSTAFKELFPLGLFLLIFCFLVMFYYFACNADNQNHCCITIFIGAFFGVNICVALGMGNTAALIDSLLITAYGLLAMGFIADAFGVIVHFVTILFMILVRLFVM